jgi:dihydroorotate dehydrogenase
MGLDIANPIGLAAGIDRSGRLLRGASRAGYGFSEVGSVTPQSLAASVRRLGRRRPPGQVIPRGVNIRPAANIPNGASAERMIDDYLHCLRRLLPVADYLVLNLSSPFARRGWASDPVWLESLLTRAVEARDQYHRDGGGRVPLAIKVALAPRVSRRQQQALLSCQRAGLDGVLLVAAPGQAEVAVCRCLRQVKDLIGEMTLISVGGIVCPTQLTGRLAAGAAAVQLFSAVLGQGPALPGRWLEQLHPNPQPDPCPGPPPDLQGETA